MRPKTVFGVFDRTCTRIWAHQIWLSGVSLKRSCKMQFRRFDLRSIGPPSQKVWPNLIFAWFPHCAALREGDIFGNNAFPDKSIHWPRTKNPLWPIWISKKGVFVKQPIDIHLLLWLRHERHILGLYIDCWLDIDCWVWPRKYIPMN